MALMTRGVAPDETDVLDDQEQNQFKKEQARKTPKPKPRKKAAEVTAPSTTQEGGKKAPVPNKKRSNKTADAQGDSHISLPLTIWYSWLLNSCTLDGGAACSSHVSSCACSIPRNECSR